MTTSVERSIQVRRPSDVVASVATDPSRALPVMAGLGRFAHIRDHEWDVFLDVGTIHVGGRVVASQPDPCSLTWHSVRGTAHAFSLTVVPDGNQSRIDATITLTLAGGASAWVAERLARSIMARHLEAGLEQLRHYLEFDHPH